MRQKKREKERETGIQKDERESNWQTKKGKVGKGDMVKVRKKDEN